MTIRIRLDTSIKSLLLGTFCLLMVSSQSTACPESCFCIDAFVTCSDFKFLDMTLLPPGTDTLVLSRGEMEEIPAGFLAKATELRMLEIDALTARVVRSRAFAGLSNLDLFSITSSLFDIVESDSFSGMTDVSKFHISDSKFGRADKHAFAHLSNIVDLRIWSSTFKVISEEAFYKLTDIVSFQLYQNNITSLGSKLFLGASGIDDITIYKNRIQSLSEGCFENISDVTSRLVLHANTFVCSCDVAWILSSPAFKEYLASNECTFPGNSIFRMADVTRETLCVSSTEFTVSTSAKAETTETSNRIDLLSSTDNLIRSTNEKFISTVSPRQISTSSATTTSFLPKTSSSSTSLSSQSSTQVPDQEYASSTFPDNLHTKTSLRGSSITYSTASQFSDETSDKNSDHLTTAPPTHANRKDSSTSHTYAINISDSTGDHIREGWTVAVHEASIDVDESEHAQPYSTSAVEMTSNPDNASVFTVGNWLSIVLLSGLCLVLTSTP